jgi:hypothetical protein
MSKLIRRIHMYFALALAPWVLMYAVSTFVMNHREWFNDGPPPFEKVEERALSADVTALNSKQAAEVLLAELGMEGAHNVPPQQPEGKVVFVRQLVSAPVRVTYDRASRSAVIERQQANAGTVLERLHRRRGWQFPQFKDDAWAFSVDAFVVAMLFWVLSGLWLWWELKVTRSLGALAILGGIAAFGFFLVRI